MADLIDRQAVQEMVDRIGGMYPYRQIGNRDSYSQYNEAWTDAINRVDAELNSLPSAQPETDGFCTDCKEYDSERHFCPRFDRVIKKTVEEMGIIHCRDCKHWMPYDWMFSEVWQSKNMNDYPEKEIGCAYCDMNMGANDFCSRAERREK